jgi:hypothetical protein
MAKRMISPDIANTSQRYDDGHQQILAASQ